MPTPKKTFRLPHTLVLIFILLLGVYLLALIIPSGEFQRVKKTFQGVERQVTLPGTYKQIEKRHLGPEWLVIAPVRGFAAACFNPFTVGIAQGFSDLPLYSGLGYRLVLWLLGTAIIVAYVMVYAEKVRKKPELSPVYELDRGRSQAAAAPSSAPAT